MAFKVQRVSKVKAPPTLPGTSNNKEHRFVNDKSNSSQLKGSAGKPKVPEKPHGDLHSKKNTGGSDHNQNKPVNSVYAYAGVEFRPLQVTEKGAFSTAIIEGKKHTSSAPSDTTQNPLPAYEEVTLSSGNFDKINPETDILLNSHDSGGSNSALAAFTADMEGSSPEVHTDLYAEVDKGSSHPVKKKPPPMPKPYSKSKENVDIPDGVRKKPPPLPKPYIAHKDDHEEVTTSPPVPPTDEPVVDAVYAVVQKPPKPLIDFSEPEPTDENDDDDAPPPLPSRPNFEAEEDLKKSQEDIVQNEPQQEKTSKSSGIMKTIKKHIRQKSDGSQAKKEVSENKKVASNEDLTAPDVKSKKPEVKAYLVTDIVSQPSTKMFGEPEMYESLADSREEEHLSTGASDLPDGWQEVKDSGGTYYWHVASGTTQWEKPKRLESGADSSSKRAAVSKATPKPELKTVTSFPVHSMGWLELEEAQVAPHNMSDTIAECISNLARERKDLWKTSETWGGGKDLRLLLESDNLKLMDCQTKATLLVQPISKMRVWGAGRDEQKDFAYVARDQVTSKHKCHVFRCHGNISGRAIHNKLHEMCNKILAEKKKAQQQNGSTKQWSDILNTPPKPTLKDQAGFNVKPVTESKRSFSGKFIGKVDVPRPTGIDVVHKAIDVAIASRDPQSWRTCLIEITVSSVRSTDCLSQQVIAENRIKFVSFIGVARDVRFCGYISCGDESSTFLCHVFQCTPNAASFTKALEEACRLRLQSCLDTNPELAEKLIASETERNADKETNKTGAGIKGFLGKLANQAKLAGPRRNSPEPLVSQSVEQQPSSLPTESLIKYYGHQPVSVGTGLTAIREAVGVAQGTTLQICTLSISPDFITLDDSIKSGTSRKLVPLEKVSYCGVASDRVHFGLVESQGGGKFICHVFAEYKIPVSKVVEAINKVL